ncbi:prepilin-type N-terminal cleavage/methylation domain-containing protein [Bradyrhizobium sp. INPA01-394B]|uniref:Prepilin-type N-terminal cleavage/methylation domain-containing protein n=1 Tax=Bradyrhizobium campsiandrae TaxID=1729892 RepID=A0ABR7U8U1_9BRAD|nr:prepilin-type N-terminal cleavage/methylation domain-containing protein [Bradyrhizobium campsiandrae]MBC9876240.1 prepilin-type N-terminal cleavage/methylation domain-containing protein [Bradyrhizobium campsiandrae]MBC9980453.1 prepilin-type N-terminal cleavage/methylation domain-containing protein [Bradyrhizobium campsiandrae]
MSRRSCSDGTAGFTLIETLVALAIIAIVLGTIGSAIAVSTKGTRSIDEHLALAGTAETLLADLPARGLLKPGRQSGELAGSRWRVDVAPMNVAGGDPGTDRFVPLVVNLRLQRADGAAIQVTTVKLAPRPNR